MQKIKSGLVALAVGIVLLSALDWAASAATGRAFVLGRWNQADHTTTLKNTDGGAALALKGKGANLQVSNSKRIKKLNADQLDGLTGADYKTNRLGWDAPYDGRELADAMVHHHYVLQASLYLVAVHRFLRWRVPGYDPDHHLLGAAYLFVRGMDPTRPPADARGVIWWRPPTAAIEALDELLRTGRRP